MPCAYGYARSILPDASNSDVTEQQDAIRTFFKDKLEPRGYLWAGVYVDAPDDRSTPLIERSAGGVMHSRTRRGDAVLVSRFDRGFSGAQDLYQMAQLWRARGIGFTVLDLPKQPNREAAMSMIAWMAKAERSRNAERVRRSHETRRERKRVRNQFPGLGFKLVGKRGSKHVEPDANERGVMARIVAMHDSDGMSFGEIARTLMLEGIVVERTGREWSRTRVYRGYQAELALRHKGDVACVGHPVPIP